MFFPGSLGLGIVIDDPVEDFPVAVVPLGDRPAAEVLSVEEGLKTLRNSIRRGLCTGGQEEKARESREIGDSHVGTISGYLMENRINSEA